MRQGKWILQQFSGLTSVNQTPSVPYLPPRNSRSAPTSKQPITSLPSPPHPHADGCPALRATLSLAKLEARSQCSWLIIHHHVQCVGAFTANKIIIVGRSAKIQLSRSPPTPTRTEDTLSTIFHLISRGWILLFRPWHAITRNGTHASSRGIIVRDEKCAWIADARHLMASMPLFLTQPIHDSSLLCSPRRTSICFFSKHVSLHFQL